MRKGITGLAAGFIAGTVLAGSAAFALGIGSPAAVDSSPTATAISRETTRTSGTMNSMNSSSSIDATHTDSGHMSIAQAQSAQHEAERRAEAAHRAAVAEAADHVAPAPKRELTHEAAHEGDTAGGTVCAPTPSQTEAPHREQMSTAGHDGMSGHEEMGHE